MTRFYRRHSVTLSSAEAPSGYPNKRLLNQPKATCICICSINQSNRTFCHMLFLFCSCVFISKSYENCVIFMQKYKNMAFNVSDACLFGHPLYFDYQDFLSFTSNSPFQVLMDENYEKCCNWIKSRNMLYDHVTWSFFVYLLFFYCLLNNKDLLPIST